jgi:hypothetical protein
MMQGPVWRCRALVATAALLVLPGLGRAQISVNTVGTIELADPERRGDGTIGAAAAAALTRGALRLQADVALKAAANRARSSAERSGAAHHREMASDPAVAGGSARGGRPPTIVAPVNINGLIDSAHTPPDATGAIGLTRYIQLVNRKFGIFDRNGALISSGSLNVLAGVAANVNTFNPQIIWDSTTQRFYYAMNSVFAANDNKLAFGFSKTQSPQNGDTDWCHYQYTPADATRFPDDPKLGDSRRFIVIGVNSFQPDFVGSDLVAISKPRAGTDCPGLSKFKVGTVLDLRDPSNARVWAPVPANQVDNSETAYVVARHGVTPATQLWFFNVTRDAGTGHPVFGTARGLSVPGYAIPADATQPAFDPPIDYSPLLDTLDARATQAVQAVNPARNTLSFWTQHTVANGTLSGVRWYEIDPVPATPVLLRADTIGTASAFLFNGAISPDRTKPLQSDKDNEFGNSFVVQYSVSNSSIPARIVAASSLNGSGYGFVNVRNGAGPYRDNSCPDAGQTVCRWGDYSSATPDPRPRNKRPLPDRGTVWGTNQYSGVVNPPVTSARWRTRIFQLAP